MQTIRAAITAVNWPAWVQAICAVATILFTVWLVRNQEAERFREERVREAAFVRDAELLLRRSDGYVREAGVALHGARTEVEAAADDGDRGRSAWGNGVFTVRAAIRSCIDLRDRLAALPVSSWPTPEMYLMFRNEHAALRTLLSKTLLPLLDTERSVEDGALLEDLSRMEVLLAERRMRSISSLLAPLVRQYAYADDASRDAPWQTARRG